MITVTYDYTGQNFRCSNYTKTFDSLEAFQQWQRVGNYYIWHVSVDQSLTK